MTRPERMIKAIDLRIDAIVAELDRQDGGRTDDGYADWQRFPGLHSFYSEAFIRRAGWVDQREADEEITQRAEYRAYRKSLAWGGTKLRSAQCPNCGAELDSAA